MLRIARLAGRPPAPAVVGHDAAISLVAAAARRLLFVLPARQAFANEEGAPTAGDADPRLQKKADGTVELLDVDAPLSQQAMPVSGEMAIGAQGAERWLPGRDDDAAGIDGGASWGPGPVRELEAAEEGQRRRAVQEAKRALGPRDWDAVWSTLDLARSGRAAWAEGAALEAEGGPVDEARPLFSYGEEEWGRLRAQLQAAGRWDAWRRAALQRLPREREALLREGYTEEELGPCDLARWPAAVLARGDRRMRREGLFREDRAARRAAPAARDEALPLAGYGAPLGAGRQAGLAPAEVDRRAALERAAGLGRSNPNPPSGAAPAAPLRPRGGRRDLDMAGAEGALPPRELLQPAAPAVCPLCRDDAPPLDFKNALLLSLFTSESGRIAPRARTGACAKHQRAVARAIKRARHAALLPFVARLPQFRGPRLPPLPGSEREELARLEPSFAGGPAQRLRPWSPLAPPGPRPWEEPLPREADEEEDEDEGDEEGAEEEEQRPAAR
eukprot:tig00000037_g10084.t1